MKKLRTMYLEINDSEIICHRLLIKGLIVRLTRWILSIA